MGGLKEANEAFVRIDHRSCNRPLNNGRVESYELFRLDLALTGCNRPLNNGRI